MVAADVTVVIPTTASEARAPTLFRAIESAMASSNPAPQVLVVVNGSKFDAAVVAQLKADERLRVVQIPEGSLPKALLAGRGSVCTDFFCFLDDDDELVPDTLGRRKEVMQHLAKGTVLTSEGVKVSGSTEVPIAFQRARITADPYSALLERNWLPSCAGLFRSDDVPREMFSDIPPFLEWTWLAQTLVERGLQVEVLEVACYRVHVTPGSLSQSKQYMQAQPGIIAAMAARCSVPKLRRRLERKREDAYFALACWLYEGRQRVDAWRALMRSGYLRHLPRSSRLTLRLLMPWNSSIRS